MGGLGFDTETTGLDFYHGVRPFIFTFCDEHWNNTLYEWDVDPLTRRPRVDVRDLEEAVDLIENADYVVLQNAKFDVTGFMLTLEDHGIGYRWPWSKTHDTLYSGHLLASNHPKDLATQCMEYLGLNLWTYEERLDKALGAARKVVTKKDSPIGDWYVAKKGDPNHPSFKGDRVWKNDLWLPRAIVQWADDNGIWEVLPDSDLYDSPWEHPWATVVSEYANPDSAGVLALHRKHLELLEERGLMKIYRARLELLPVVYDMERRGVTVSKQRIDELFPNYKKESDRLGKVLVSIAKKHGAELTLPKGTSVNNSLRDCVFKSLKLPTIEYTPSGMPALSKDILAHWINTVPRKTHQHLFCRTLKIKRRYDSDIGYMEQYLRFGLPGRDRHHIVLHSSLNVTATDTLRFSSERPNEQNISKKEVDEDDDLGRTVRYAFGPEPGREWYSMDAQNIELRIPAYESGEQELIRLFENPDEPPYYGSVHLLNFHTVYPDLWQKQLDAVGFENVGPACKKIYASTWYQWCKNGGFAVQYGAQESSGTADRAFHKPGAQALLMERFSRLGRHNQWCIDYAEQHGHVETIPDQTVDPDRGYPLLCTRSQCGKILPTVPLNYRTQSTAMWWMFKAMVRCYDQLEVWRSKGVIDAWIVMQIHDELVFDFPARGKKNWPYVRKLKRLMEQGGDDIGVPTPVGVEYHPNNWGEGETLKL